MYIVLQFGSNWILFDRNNSTSRLLEKTEVDILAGQFRNIIGKGALNVFQLNKINPSRLTKMLGSGYVLLRVGEIWTIYEGGKLTPEILDKGKISAFNAVFPGLVDEQMLSAIAIDILNPTKLLHMPTEIISHASQTNHAAGLANSRHDQVAVTGFKSSG